jgi:hypothetical protein
MKAIPFFVVGSLFALKLLSNAMIPATLARLPRGPKGEKPGVSLMPYVEAVLLVVLLALSALGLAPYRFTTTLLAGIAAIVLSYVLLYVVAMTMALYARIFRR